MFEKNSKGQTVNIVHKSKRALDMDSKSERCVWIVNSEDRLTGIAF
jgi:hypothetical protein